MYVADLDTPTLTIDLDALNENLDRYQAYYNQHGMGLRPHIKTHKTLAVARMQMEKGAIGLTCQKVGEAEVLVSGGLNVDILIPYNIIGRQKLDRLCALATQTQITVAADSAYTVRGLSEAATANDVTLGVLVEVETGQDRTGVITPGQAGELAALIDSLPGLELRGIMGFPTPPTTRPLIQAVLAEFDRRGLPYPIVSGGSTKSALQAHEIPELTEYRIGEYPVGGEGHLREGRHTVEQCALRVIATVVSRPTDGRAILDCGSKTMSASMLTTEKGPSVGYIVEYPDAHFYGFSEEHGHVDVSACPRKPEIGERVQVLPVHPCPCVNLHEEMVALRKGKVEAVWPIYLRGKIR
ncbi:MAG: D-TA family PLP-dependent enzyme [Caldilineaceae bacterium]|nr:D-TA family PLP-dependent enzyme [Caldilineaceae bacterium]